MLLVVANAIEMAESFECRRAIAVLPIAVLPKTWIAPVCRVFAKIVDDGARRGNGLGVRVEAEAGQFGHAELFAQDALRVIELKDPIFETRFDAASAIEQGSFRRLEKLLRTRKQSLAGMEKLQLVTKIVVGARPGKFRGLKFAGGEIDVSEADGRAGRMLGYGGEEIVFARVKDGDIGGGARGDDAHDFAADNFFARAGLLHLVADGDLESGADEFGDVAVGGVIRDAAHRNRLALFAIPRGQRDLQFARGEHGVFVEKFVEIAEAKEQQRMRVARFYRMVLLHQRCSGIGHRASLVVSSWLFVPSLRLVLCGKGVVADVVKAAARPQHSKRFWS